MNKINEWCSTNTLLPSRIRFGYVSVRRLQFQSLDIAKGQKIYLFSIFIVSILSCFILLCRTKCALSITEPFFFCSVKIYIHIHPLTYSQAKGLFLCCCCAIRFFFFASFTLRLSLPLTLCNIFCFSKLHVNLMEWKSYFYFFMVIW